MKILPVSVKSEAEWYDILSQGTIGHDVTTMLDDLLELAGDICACPIVVITLLQKKHYWHRVKQGDGLVTSSSSELFFADAFNSTEIIVIRDASLDDRFKSNPFISAQAQICFYASVPILLSSGSCIGNLSVMHIEPGDLSAHQRKSLRLLANQAGRFIELETRNKRAGNLTDGGTRMKNENMLKAVSLQEKRNEFIANTLHEGLAQELAANKLYLQMAVESEQMRLPLIRKAEENLGKLVQDICALSNSIVPTRIKMAPLDDLIRDYLNQEDAHNKFNIHFSEEGDIDSLSLEARVILLKSIEKWLKMLTNKNDVSVIKIELSVFETAILTIEDDSSHHDLDAIENADATIRLEARINSLGGSGDIVHLSPKGNLLTVVI